MPHFLFEAVDASGVRTRGREDARDAAALALTLEARGLFVLDVSEAAQAGRLAFGFSRRRELLEFTRAMAALVPAGLPLTRALLSAAELTTGQVRRAVERARVRVVDGEPLAAALAGDRAVFSPLYVGLLRAGERRGEVAAAFAQLAAQLEREEQLRGRILSALLYPMLLGVAGALAVGVLLVVVLPAFTAILTDTGATLPRSTRILLALSALARDGWPAMLTLILGGVFTMGWLQRTTAGQRRLSQLLLALPLVGPLRRQVLAARFARLLGTLIGGSAPLYGALGDVIESTDDVVAREAIGGVRNRVREGGSLRAAVAEVSVFPPLLAQLIAVGEESSRLREFLLKAADILDERAQRTAQRTATLAEPAMIVVFGAIVAVIAFALLQAIYSVNAGSFVR